MARRDKPRLEWEGADAYFALRNYSRHTLNKQFFARIGHNAAASSYWVLTNDFDTTNRTFETYEGARGYILALYALID